MNHDHVVLRLDASTVEELMQPEGANKISMIARLIRAEMAKGAPVARIALGESLRAATNGHGILLREHVRAIQDGLNAQMLGQYHICLRHDGDLEAKPGMLNTVHPADLKDQIHGHFGSLVSNPESAFDVPPEEWKDHVVASRTAVRNSEQQYGGGKLAPDHAGRRLRGTAAEFMLHRVLERYMTPPADPRDEQIRLVRRQHQIHLPEPQREDEATYQLHFPSEFNCELRSRRMEGSSRERSRHAFSVATNLVTEFDALAVTDLDPKNLHAFQSLYIFEPTTSTGGFPHKVSQKEQKLQKFRADMAQRGVGVHVFHSIFHDRDDPPLRLESIGADSMPKDTHLMKLPLLSSVRMVAQRTAKELGIKIT